jgi:excisionase family DNA binding protein
MTDQLLTPEQVAQIVGLSRRAIYRAIERGDLQASKLCARLRIREADLDDWIQSRRVEPSGSPEPRLEHRRRAGLRDLLDSGTKDWRSHEH